MKKKLGIFALTVVLSLGLSFQAFAAEYAICIGKDFKDGGKYEANLNTIPAATKASRYFINAGYDSYVCVQPTIGLLKSNNDDRTPIMSSSILYFNGEGTVNSVSWWEGEDEVGKCGVIASDTVSGSSYCNITKENFRNVKLAMFMACNTAPMADYAVNNGAKSALGFHYKVKATDMEKFSQRVTLRLSRGDTLNEALKYATELGGYLNDSITNFKVKGGSNRITYVHYSDKQEDNTIKVKKEDENGNIVTEEMYVEPYVEEETMPEIYDLEKERVTPIPCTAENLSLEEISNYIKENIDSNFDINRYEVNSNVEPDSEMGVLLFKLKIGDFITNSGYTIIAVDGYVTDIAKAGIIDYNLDIIEEESNMSEKEMKADAIEKDNLTNIYDVTNQEIEKRIDMETGRCYYIVFTEYENKEDGGGRLESQEYDINAKIIEKAPAETDTQSLEEQPQEEQADDKKVTENETNDEKVIDKETDNKEIADENKTDTEQKDNPVNENETNDKKVIDKETDDKETADKTKTDTEQKDNQISENETTDEKVNENETDKEINKEETENRESNDKDVENETIEKKTPVEAL